MTRRFRVAGLLFIVSICVAQGLGAQPTTIKFKHLTPDDGLPDGEVGTILQDRRGFMWFGTWGWDLVRYDGYEFTAFSRNPEDSACLSNDAICKLYAGRDGIFWIVTLGGGGLDRFDNEVNSFFTLAFILNHPKSRSAACRSDASHAGSETVP